METNAVEMMNTTKIECVQSDEEYRNNCSDDTIGKEIREKNVIFG